MLTQILRALENSILYKNQIFQCMGKKSCVDFKSFPLKLHTKYLTHTLEDDHFIKLWKFKCSQIWELVSVFEAQPWAISGGGPPSGAVRAMFHYGDVIMSTMASQITSVSIVCLTICSCPDQRNHQSSTSLAFVRGIHRCIPRTKGQ